MNKYRDFLIKKIATVTDDAMGTSNEKPYSAYSAGFISGLIYALEYHDFVEMGVYREWTIETVQQFYNQPSLATKDSAKEAEELLAHVKSTYEKASADLRRII